MLSTMCCFLFANENNENTDTPDHDSGVVWRIGVSLVVSDAPRNRAWKKKKCFCWVVVEALPNAEVAGRMK